MFWCPCMAIGVKIQYNGGFLPDIILLTQGYYHWDEELLSLQPMFLPSYFVIPLECECSGVLDAFRFFFKRGRKPKSSVTNE